MEHSLSFAATFFDGRSSEPYPAQVVVSKEAREIRVHSNDSERRFSFDKLRVEARLGNAPRSIYLQDDMQLECSNNDAIDELEVAIRGASKLRVRAHLLESSWKWAGAAVLVTGLVCALAFKWGVPWLAQRVAEGLPPRVVYQLGEGTLDALDQVLFEPSTLPLARKEHVRDLLSRVSSDEPELPIHLECRQAGMPNAFALPNGTIVVTDEFVELAKSDDELTAVLAHEVGHVKHRHTLRLALENSAIGLIAFAYLGDVSQLAGIVASLPTILAHAHYSQGHETEADTYALSYLKAKGLPTEAFADILERMEQTIRGSDAQDTPEVLRYLESHPGTRERIQRFRNH
jgi:Zn-dependent protease with chaperone function